jgi:hypothetical protein
MIERPDEQSGVSLQDVSEMIDFAQDQVASGRPSGRRATPFGAHDTILTGTPYSSKNKLIAT